ncbi:hypothetical protein PF005_g11262 [Phytophthora fragariae]|nr:hypothetical protein PF003_g35337 [Phytophthora fragariae]KAE9210802.1 hypothetical protein PF005_g11262 [Phytophthora fragariae]KAE9339383.1 hypothetical protein PF008_g11603 [Phytophthora fragariae]
MTRRELAKQRVVDKGCDHSSSSDDGGGEDGGDGVAEAEDLESGEDEGSDFSDDDELRMGLVRYTAEGVKPFCLHCLEDNVEKLKQQVQELKKQGQELKEEVKKHSEDNKKRLDAFKEELMKQVKAKVLRVLSNSASTSTAVPGKTTTPEFPRVKSVPAFFFKPATASSSTQSSFSSPKSRSAISTSSKQLEAISPLLARAKRPELELRPKSRQKMKRKSRGSEDEEAEDDAESDGPHKMRRRW